MKLAPKIIIIVLLASFVPLLVLAQLTIMGVTDFGENARSGVINVSQVYIVKAGEEAVKMKTDELGKKLEIYFRNKLRENPNLNTTDILKDPDFLEIASRRWGMGEYTWVMGAGLVGGEWRVITLVYPTLPKDKWGKDIKYDLKWNESIPEFYNLSMKAVGYPAQIICDYYTWVEPETNEAVEKYGCYQQVLLPTPIYDPYLKSRVVILAGTGAYIDGYFKYLTQSPGNPTENIAGEVTKSIEKAGEQVYMNLLIAFVVAVVFVGLIAFFTITRIAKPIIELSKTADKISAGEVDTEVPFRNRADEIGILANSVERLKRSLKVAMQSLEEALK
ncbi:MAG: HAMP domain-containing protein [Archaeoglobaceae archaeon]|nr:HAMP domain-containing protein [Archaeoglobaceae archaeon]MDW8117479.1 HAMP domain-containing protein [Archaeoglobaceae archaeon]